MLAFSFGLGMMTKISVGTIALFTGGVMIYCVVKDFKQKKYKEIICQLAVFAVICLPLGMWYSVRNFILFDQPFGYVQVLPINDPIYTGNVEWYKRFFDFNIIELIKHPFSLCPEGHSIPIQVVKTSAFAESKYNDNVFASSIFVIVNLITIITSIVSTFYVVIKGKVCDNKIRFGAFIVWLIIVVSFIQFNIQYPYLCTADYRYITITALLGALFMNEAMYCTNNVKVKNTLKIIMLAFVVCVLSVYM